MLLPVLEDAARHPLLREPGTTTPPPSWELGEFALDYLSQRHVPQWLTNSLPITETSHGILFGFPGFEYWQERRWKQFAPPRWKNAPGLGTSDGVYYHVATSPHDARCFLVEGIIDALVVGSFTNAAAALSGHLHVAQLEDLAARYGQLVYMPDGDVPLDKAMAEFTKMPLGSGYVQLPVDKDPAELGKEIEQWL